jgi:AcrR family transcriptional regulator
MARKKPAGKAHALRAELYRGLVLEAAEQEFADHGFAEARMQRVADAVGLSVGTLYNLFESKEALYAAVYQSRVMSLLSLIQEALAVEASIVARIESAVRAYVTFAAQHPNYLRMNLQRGNTWSTQAGHRPGWEQKSFSEGVGAAAALLSQAIARGELVDEPPRRMVLTLIGVHQAQLQAWVETGMAEPADEVASRIASLFRRMYVP